MQRLTVLVDEPIGRIHPRLHGQFAEHLGAQLDGGLWVGRDSSVPNVEGIRLDVIDALKPLGIPLLRWPGGCFADHYNWRDGVGPVEKRPARVNHNWGFSTENNQFGTHEFMTLCRVLGAEPYVAANVASSTPRELLEWVEYCNFDGASQLSSERRRNGADEPFRVRFWGVGNEAWGCGGNMTAREYAAEFCRFRTFLHAFERAPVEAIACGPDGPDWSWTEELMAALSSGGRNRLHLVQHIAAHYYCGTAGSSTEYSDAQWTSLLARAHAMDGIISGHRVLMDRFDPGRRIGLAIDEWGTWHPPQPGKPPRGLWQQNTMRDALAAAITLDVFNRHADILTMANLAQLVNVLQAPILVDGDQVIRTPTWHVLMLHKPHRGRTSVRVVHDVEALELDEETERDVRRCWWDGRAAALGHIHASASVDGNSVCITLVNAHPSDAAELRLTIPGAPSQELEVAQLAGDDIYAFNDALRPGRVVTTENDPVAIFQGEATVTVPAASVVRLRSARA